MSISSISSLAGSSSCGPLQQRRQDFRQLGQALQQGDLNSANAAFAELTQDLASSKPGSTAGLLSNPSSPLGQDFAAIGKDLQNGDVATAKQDFGKLQSDLKAQSTGHAPGHHGHHRLKVSADGAESQTNSATPSTTTSPINPETGTGSAGLSILA
jgi:hypothetical protein